jgi:hypothetical protein
MFADPVVEEVPFYPIGGAEVEVGAVMLFKKARRAEIHVRAQAVDISPEGLRVRRHIRFPRQVGAPFRDRRGVAEVEAV